MSIGVIVVSGMPCAGSSIVAEKLAQKLGLRYFSIGKYFKEKALEVSKGEETERAANFLESKEGGSEKFHLDLDELQKQLASEGNIVIDSKLGILMLKDLADFSVWLKADLNIRVERTAKRDDIPEGEALKILKEKESLEHDTWKRVYGFDYFSAEQKADLVVDTSQKSADEIVDEIITKLKKIRISEKK